MNPFEDFERDEFDHDDTPARDDLIFHMRCLDNRSLLKRGSMIPGLGRSFTEMAASNNVILIATSDNLLLRWNLDNSSNSSSEMEEIEISRRPEDAIEKIFLDSYAYHAIIALKNGDNYYLHCKSTRPKKLSKLNGNIECLAFDKHNTTEQSTKSFLVGTRTGKLYEISVDNNGREKVCQMVYQLEQSVAITSIFFDYINPDNADSRIFILMATSTPMRLYNFVGDKNFQKLFQDHIQTSTLYFTELPGESLRTTVHCDSERQRSQKTSHRFVVLTKIGIYHGSLLFASSQGRDNLILEDKLQPLDSLEGSDPSIPMAISCSDFHFLLLKKDRVQAMSRLNGVVVEEMLIKKEDGAPKAIIRDSLKNSIFVFTDMAVFQINILKEDRYVWNIYLEKALTGEEKYFDSALSYCPDEAKKKQVLHTQAQHFLKNGQFEKAALHFAKSGVSFDEAVLSILQSRGANSIASLNSTNSDFSFILTSLRIYLLEVLELLPPSSKSQRTMVSTWLSEIYLHEIEIASLNGAKSKPSSSGSNNKGGKASGGGGDRSNRAISAPLTEVELVDQFKEFLRNNKASLDIATTLNLVSGRNQRPLLLFLAKIMGDYDKVVGYYLTEKMYMEIIKLFSESPFEKVETLIYKVSPLLFEFMPEDTVCMLSGKPNLKVSRLLPAILRYCEVLDKCSDIRASGAAIDDKYLNIDRDIDGNKTNFAVKYLKEYTSEIDSEAVGKESESAAYHCLVWLLAAYDDVEETEIVELLQSLANKKESGTLCPDIDLEYILRECRRHNRVRSVVYAHLLLGMDEEAVHAALDFDIELAKSVAQRINNETMQRTLWISIARHVIESEKDVRQAISLLQESNVIKIEDLLPFLPDFTELDVFKEQICETLQDYSTRIENLKGETNDLSESADSTSIAVDAMKKRGYTTHAHQRCEDCEEYLFSGQFYLFPCSHAFHEDCITHRVFKCLNASQIQAIQAVKDKIPMLQSRVKDGDKRALSDLELHLEELDQCIAGDCPLCGYLAIKALAIPLVSNLSERDIAESKSWEL